MIWVGQITQTQHLSKDYESERVVVCLRGTRGEIAYGSRKEMLLHQRDDADADMSPALEMSHSSLATPGLKSIILMLIGQLVQLN